MKSMHREKTYEEVIKRNSETVYKLAYSLVRAQSDADDIYQEVFLRYVRKAPVFDSEEHEKAWFMRVTINCCKNFWKSPWIQKRSVFENRYKKAYSTITPSQELVADTIDKACANSESSVRNQIVVKVSLTAAAAVLCFAVALPSSTSQGITMQVEAVNLEGNEAEVIISLSDAEDSTQDLVHGEMDLFDSYNLSDYTNDLIVGGCQFLTYDENDDKAYFLVYVQADNAYQSGKLQFSVHSILCDKYSITKDVDLSGIVYTADTKSVTLSGSGGPMTEDMLPDFLKDIPATQEDPRPKTNVLDLSKAADCTADDFTLTGIAYMDGVLRVQMCMGDNWSSDRHVQLFLKDSNGKERYEDHSVSWHEDVGDTSYQFYEFWYVEDIDDIADYSMYGVFHDSGGCARFLYGRFCACAQQKSAPYIDIFKNNSLIPS